MRFGRLDLNLLVALDALLTEQSVSLAAERIFLSQSATSSALGRLRDYFEDELLVIKGRQMVLTPRAEELVEPVRSVLEQIRTTIAVSAPFDPATSDRVLRIMASDFIVEVVLANVLAEIHTLAPNMRFEIQAMNQTPVETLERGFVDLLITIDYAISNDHPSRILFEEDYVVVGWSKNPAMKEEMTEELYLSLSHVTARFGKGRVSAFEEWFVHRQKRKRNLGIVAPNFTLLPRLIIGSNRIATMHRRLAKHFAEYLPLTIKEVPFSIPPVREALQWHTSSKNDPAILWVVEQICAFAEHPTSQESNGEDSSALALAREALAAQFLNENVPRKRE